MVKLRDCKDIQDTGNHHGDGMYRLDLTQQGTSVECDMTTDGGGWTVIFYGSLLWPFCLFLRYYVYCPINYILVPIGFRNSLELNIIGPDKQNVDRKIIIFL